MSEVKHKVIAVSYNLHKDTAEGELIETTEGKEPLRFLSGLGQMIPDFENNVVNLNQGDPFSFSIKAEDAYGTRTEEAIIELPQDIFKKEGKLVEEVQVNNVLPLQDQNGNVVPAKVVAINTETITVDESSIGRPRFTFYGNSCGSESSYERRSGTRTRTLN